MTDSGRILVRHGTDGWSEPEIKGYTNEAHLQKLLVADPARVPGVSSDSLAVEELNTMAGPIDVCIVGMDGRLTVVECKLESNPERRRMVIGQVLDYASGISTAGAEAFFAAWRLRGGLDLRTTLEPSAFQRLIDNIDQARIHLCLAVDLIDSDLRRLVEYLNRITREDIVVTALQLTYAQHAGVQILIPTTFGGEIAAAKTRGSGATGHRWSREQFIEALADDEDRQRVLRLLELLDGTERRGKNEPLKYGLYPEGGVLFHPYGFERSPFQLSLTAKGKAMISGNWTWYTSIPAHPGFAPLANVLGLDYRGPARSVSLALIDIDAVWEAALDCAVAINE